MQYLKGHSDRATRGVRRWRNTSASFGLVAIVFHWTIALLFLAQLALGYFLSRDIDPVLQFNLFQYHKSIGFLVLALAAPRFIWSVFSRKPRALDGGGMASRLAARSAHAALLFLTLAVPLAGWAVASTSPLQIPSYVFDLVVVPGLPMAISDQAEAFWTEVHATLAYLAAVIVVLHVAAALWHHFVRKDPTLRRMIPFRAAEDNRSRTASPRK
ncbi:putative cytochrome b561 [Agrobacterium fabacearum CFBP 5771]|uniref:cytochrome b n=1 Tax=Agrobacterium tumefaciens TaxID=358 RepID=UPI00046FE22E|nr:cytochrome b [Agrobacterium tumefaciens]MDR5008736.1 cytochrome b [Agrobacterium tumefaciens]NSY58486.1 cytochrome b [Agrobacterium tumefaciens]NTZ59958.1 cytochrome b [Agrobacterium tumefaciens]UXR91152.1 cytochrome b [Agrobacterium tumefaciens]CVI16779.1 putative cytochrome b561 [Agrobacterium fabacearum CFBP 5771]